MTDLKSNLLNHESLNSAAADNSAAAFLAGAIS